MKYDLAKYRMSDSKEKINSAKILLNSSQYKDSVSRSYYAMFSAARALLSIKKLDSTKHSGIISLFNQHFVKTNIVKKEMGRFLAEAKIERERSDYVDFIITSRETTQKQLDIAQNFVQEVEKSLNKIWNNQ